MRAPLPLLPMEASQQCYEKIHVQAAVQSSWSTVVLFALFGVCLGIYLGWKLKAWWGQTGAMQHSVGSQAQTTYLRTYAQPRFHVLPESAQG